MPTNRLHKAEAIDSATYQFLWDASNVQLASTPTISRHLAAALVANVPVGGMSSFARRMHCKKCNALMHITKVRIRKIGKKSAYGNKVRRTCGMCGGVNSVGGVAKGGKPEQLVDGAVDEMRRELRASTPKEGERVKATEEVSVAKTPISKTSKAAKTPISKASKAAKTSSLKASSMSSKAPKTLSSGKKKNKRKSLQRETPERRSDTPRRSGLAASFLFEPL